MTYQAALQLIEQAIALTMCSLWRMFPNVYPHLPGDDDLTAIHLQARHKFSNAFLPPADSGVMCSNSNVTAIRASLDWQ
jgi:hypothetical protein